LDIKNEPHGSTTWDEWGLVVNKFIQHVTYTYPEFKGVFFVEGVQGKSCWGGSFTDIDHKLFITPQIVFSPHTYGVSVLGDVAINYGEKEFYEWYGFLTEKFNNTIIIGEAGGFYQGEDLEWHKRYSDYLKKIDQRSSFYWCLNPDSADTRGLLNDDWTTSDGNKLSFLQDLQPNPNKIDIKNDMIISQS
jgi:endoglucanase